MTRYLMISCLLKMTWPPGNETCWVNYAAFSGSFMIWGLHAALIYYNRWPNWYCAQLIQTMHKILKGTCMNWRWVAFILGFILHCKCLLIMPIRNLVRTFACQTRAQIRLITGLRALKIIQEKFKYTVWF